MSRVFCSSNVSGNDVSAMAVGNTVSSKTSEQSGRSGIFFAVILLIGTVCAIGGIAWFCWQGYQDSVLFGPTRTIFATVDGVEQQVDEETFKNAVAQINKYHLTTTYNDSAGTHNVVLNEGYIDKELAESMIGETRRARISLSDYSELDHKMSMWFSAPLFVGLLIYIVCGIVYINKRDSFV